MFENSVCILFFKRYMVVLDVIFDILLSNIELLDSQKEGMRDNVGFGFYLSSLLPTEPCLTFICCCSLIISLSLDEVVMNKKGAEEYFSLSCGTSVISVYLIESLKKLLPDI